MNKKNKLDKKKVKKEKKPKKILKNQIQTNSSSIMSTSYKQPMTTSSLMLSEPKTDKIIVSFSFI